MKILIVDDEPGVAQRLADVLGAAGCGECFAARDAEEAVEIVNREGTLDVLVTDAIMEGIDGFTLHETLHPHLPGLQTIFLAKVDLSDHAAQLNGCPVLLKPVDESALTKLVRDLEVGVETPGAPASPELSDPLLGVMLGAYRVETLLGADRDGKFYQAVQTSIDRPAELHALDPGWAEDPAQVDRFMTDARTKANVHHQALLSVFEAGQQDGVYFYTSENRNGSSLAELAARGAKLEPRVVLQLLHSVAEVMVHLAHEKILHAPLDASHVLVDHRMRTRLVNIATSEASGVTAVQEMQALASAISPVLALTDQSSSVRQLLFEMESESVTLRSWNALLYEVKRCASGASSPQSQRLDASGRAAIAAVAAARKNQRKVRRAIILASVLIPLSVGGFWGWKVYQSRPVPFIPEGNPAWETMVKIPAGEFTFQDGRIIVLPDYWIDTHEVTIGQYADFLVWLGSHPEQAGDIGPTGMPDGHSFVPAGWADQQDGDHVTSGYHSIARAGGTYQGATLTLDSPVFGVDWYDAQAYAQWKGHRLPTEGEWERAALGTQRKKYPWGDGWQLGNANIAAQDGFEKWSGVDAIPADRSPEGVIGMAGNVSEWTQTVTTNAAGATTPIIRGGNWSDAVLDIRRRLHNLEASQNAPTVGFRTVADKPPQP